MDYCRKNCKVSDEITHSMHEHDKKVYIHNQAISKINNHYEEMNKRRDEMFKIYEELEMNRESLSIRYEEINKCKVSINEHYESMISCKLPDSKDVFYKRYEEIRKNKKIINNYDQEIQNTENRIWFLENEIRKNTTEIYEHLHSVKNHMDECNPWNKESLVDNLNKWEYKLYEEVNKNTERDRLYETTKYRSCGTAYKLDNDACKYIKELEKKYEKIDENIETHNNEFKEIDEKFKNINQKFKEIDKKIMKMTNILEINKKIFEILVPYLEKNDSKCKK